jgi:hypothetical protein
MIINQFIPTGGSRESVFHNSLINHCVQFRNPAHHLSLTVAVLESLCVKFKAVLVILDSPVVPYNPALQVQVLQLRHAISNCTNECRSLKTGAVSMPYMKFDTVRH